MAVSLLSVYSCKPKYGVTEQQCSPGTQDVRVTPACLPSPSGIFTGSTCGHLVGSTTGLRGASR
jgi:hypothetical protein